jgi:hypothetical protein
MVAESVHISTNVVSSNPAHDDVYLIQHYVIKYINSILDLLIFRPLAIKNLTLLDPSIEHDVAASSTSSLMYFPLDVVSSCNTS